MTLAINIFFPMIYIDEILTISIFGFLFDFGLAFRRFEKWNGTLDQPVLVQGRGELSHFFR